MINDLKVSLLIPTLNAGDDWLVALKSINEQSFPIYKKIIIDSGSTDTTVELARSFDFKVSTIQKKDFNHGATRQLLVNLSDNIDICILLTQDAILASPDSIYNIIKAFDDPQVSVAYGRQLPHKNAKSLETHARLFNYPDKSEIVSINDVEQKGFKAFFCSNSFSAYRRKTLLETGGFPSDSIMGEDAIVAAKMLTAGYKKAYVAEAAVYHSHSYTLLEEYRRYFDTRVFHEQNIWLINDFGKPTGEGLKFIKSELKYVLKNDKLRLFKSVGSVFAKWLGYNSGRFFKSIPLALKKKLSMHSFYWK